MKWKIPPFETFLSLRFLSLLLYLIVLLFQLSLLIRTPFFYLAGGVAFVALVVVLCAGLAARLRREKVLILVLVFIVLLRLPFYLHYNGLMTTSDNAIDALQAVETQDTRLPPFFLLEDVKHIGTIGYMWTSFFNAIFGTSYLVYVLVQLAVFIAFLFVLWEFFKSSVNRSVLLFFLFLHFAFIETFFDTSLSLRGGPYLAMVLFFAFGAILFDFSLENKGRIFLSYAFVFFSLYIHPLSSLFAGSFLLCTLVYAWRGRKLLRTAALAAAGMAAGLFHWFYYLLFFPAKPVSTGAWEQIRLIPFSKVTPAYLGRFLVNFWATFRNLFSFEFSYLRTIMPGGTGRAVLSVLNESVIYLSLAVFAAGTIIIILKIIRLLSKRDGLRAGDWVMIFLFFLLGAGLVKVFVFYPPHQEPRHNFELMFLVMASYLLVSSCWLKPRALKSWKTIAAAVLFLAMTAPHAFYFYKNAAAKDASYRELMAVLSQNKVRALAADFNIAYSVYFLSGRRVLVSDSLGPFSVPDFYPELRGRVDKLPAEKKAYVFYSASYPARPWHRQATEVVRTRLLDRLRKDGIACKIIRLKDYLVVIPALGR